MQFQLGQRLAEEELTGQAKTVHRALAILTDEHFIEVRLKNFAFVVMQLKQHRHHGFRQLAAQAALVGQVEVLDQLLGQRTATLGHLAARGVDPDGPGNRFGRHPPVAIEIPVFNRDQGFQQVRRDLIELDQNPVFEIFRVDPADQQRLQPHHGELRPVQRRQLGHIVTGEAHTHRLGLLHAFIELETTGVQVHGIAADRSCARAVGHAFAAIAQGIEFRQEIFLAELLSDEQLQRTGINLGGNGPALAGELLLDHGIKVNGKACQHHEADQTELQGPAQPRAQAFGGTFFCSAGGSGTSHGGGLYALYS